MIGPKRKHANDSEPDRPIYRAIGKVAYQEHYSDDILAGYVVFGQVRGTNLIGNTLYLEQIAEDRKPEIVKAVQKAEHCRRGVNFLPIKGGPISLDMVKLLEVILLKENSKK